MPSNVGQRRPEIDATCTIGSHQLSNRAINGGFKFLDRSLGTPAKSLLSKNGNVRLHGSRLFSSAEEGMKQLN
jgi:hypothetical protein